MVSEWAKRFHDNIYPSPNKMGFDGLGKLENESTNKAIINKKKSKREKEKERLGFRMDELAVRISRHAGIPATLPLPPSYLKNPQCPPKTWDGLLSKEGRVIYKECKADSHKRICVKWYNTETYTFVFCFCEDPELKDWEPDEDPNRRAWKSTSNQKSLIMPRHNPYEKSLEIADYVSSYFPPRWPDAIIAYEGNTKQEPDRNYGFWLINEEYADFVYAILKSSMFRAWCELTANTDGKGQGHFTVGMWDTFPLPKLTEAQERKIITAGQDIKKGRPQSQEKLDKFVDRLFKPANSLTDKCRKRILAGEFLKVFSSLRMDVASLALRCLKPEKAVGN